MESISDQARRWAVRADAGPLSPDDERALAAWLDADPRHRGAYVMARARWTDLDRLAALNGFAESEPSPTASAESRAPHQLSRRRLLGAGLAAGLVGGTLSWAIWRQGRDTYSTAIGEVRRIPLSDGSTLLLNTATEVTVRLTPERRVIQLERGEALFEVAHDESRPFVVHANDTAVRAVGTAFAVRLEASQVDITVTEGVVELSSSADRFGPGPDAVSRFAPAVARVKANERVVIAHAQPLRIEPIPNVQVDRQLAWRQGMVSFDGESLRSAVREINRHNRRQIVVDDPALGSRPLVGVFRATDIEAFCEAAATILNARTVEDGEVIRLEPDPAAREGKQID